MRSLTWIKRTLLIACALAVASALARIAWADSVPDWVRKPPVEDSANRYYVGRSSGLENDAEAFKQAEVNARDSAIRELYGLDTAINAQTYQDLSGATSIERVNESSRRVHVVGFERVDQYREDHDGKISVWILFKYPKAATEAERRRLAQVQAGTEAPLAFSEVGDAGSASDGVLELRSSPENASVVIDGESWGRTPLRLIGKLAPGPHTLYLDDPTHVAITEQVVIVPGKTVQVSEILKPAMGQVRIETTPEGAEVTVGGKFAGLSPVDVTVPTGQPVTLKLSHPEAQDYAETLVVGKNDTRTLTRVLPLKPSSIAVASEPGGASVSLDGAKPVGVTPTGFFAVEPGTHTVSVTKDGYVSHEETVTVHGGQRLTLPLVHLTAISETDKALQAEQEAAREHLESYPIIIGASLGESGAPSSAIGASLLGVGLSFEKRFSILGVRVSGLHAGGTANDQFISSWSGSLDLPVYVWGGFALVPSVGKGWTTVSPNGEAGSTSASFNQRFVGVGVEYSIFPKPDSNWGVGVSTGLHRYQDAEGAPGTTSFSGAARLLLRF